MGSSYRLKTTEPPHHKLSAEYRRKRRLCIQNRSAGFILSCCNPSGQQEVPTFCLRKQGISVSTSLPSEHCPSGIYSHGTHNGSLPPLSGDIRNPVSRQLVDTPPRLSSVFTPPVSVITNTELGRPHYTKRNRTRTIQDIQFLGLRLHLESFPLNIQSSGDNSTRMQNILPENVVVYRSVPIHGITQLFLRSHPTGLSTFEAPTTTFSFVWNDKPVYTTVLIRPFSPCHPTQAMAGLIVSHVRNPYPTFPGGVYDFHGCRYPGLRRPQWGFQDCRGLDPFRTQAPHKCAGAQGSNICPLTQGCSITGPSCYDRYRQYHCCRLYQQTG